MVIEEDDEVEGCCLTKTSLTQVCLIAVALHSPEKEVSC